MNTRKEKQIAYPFKFFKLVTIKNKVTIWETQNDEMEVEHPLFTQINFPYSKQMVKAYPLKNPQEHTRTDLKNIVLQNNFTNISMKSHFWPFQIEQKNYSPFYLDNTNVMSCSSN